MKTGIDGVTRPAIGPTASWWWHGSKRTAPEAARLVASSTLFARPSCRSPPITAPRIGPHIRSHVTGGPAWRKRSSAIPGMTSRAMPMPTRCGRLARRRARARAFAASISREEGPERSSPRCAIRRGSPPEGGSKSTSVTAAPVARGASATASIPAWTTSSRPSRRVDAFALTVLVLTAPPPRGREGGAPRLPRPRARPTIRRGFRRGAGPPPAGRSPAGRGSSRRPTRRRPAGRPARAARAATTHLTSSGAGSGCAPSPRTRSRRRTRTERSAPAARISEQRTVWSTIGCGRPTV